MNINDAFLKIISTKETSSAGLIGTLLSESREGRQVKGYILYYSTMNPQKKSRQPIEQVLVSGSMMPYSF